MFERMSIACIVVLLLLPLAVDAQLTELPSWEQPEYLKSREVLLGFGEIDRAGWGRYSPNERKYFKEMLPCYFERTMQLTSMDWNRGIDWVFTGPRAGFNIEIRKEKVLLYTKYYDSIGFEISKQRRMRHPQLEAPRKVFPYSGELKAVTLKVDHKLQLSIQLNGKTVHNQLYLPDIRRHQIRLVGEKGEVHLHILRPGIKKVAIDFNPERTFQSMLGWGGIGTATAYDELSEVGKKKWWQYLCEYNLLCQREYPVGTNLNESMDNWDNLEDAKAHYYGDNFPNGEITNFSYNSTIQNLGGFVMFEFWNLPRWVGTDPGKYTKAMVDFCKKSKAKTGRPPIIVGVQNERQLDEENVKLFVKALRKALDDAGFQAVRIHMSNAPRIRTGMEHVHKYVSNDDVWDLIDYSAVNMYDYQEHFTDPDSFDSAMLKWYDKVRDKPFISTEICINNDGYQVDSYRIALTLGQLYHKNLTLMNAIMICYCWTILNTEQPSYGQTRSLFISDPETGGVPRPSSNQLRVFGAYTRRVKKGMKRVQALSNDKDLLVTSFKQKDDRATVIMLNRSMRPVMPELNWHDMIFNTLEVTDPYHPNSVQDVNIIAESGHESVIVQPGAIVTLTNVPLNRLPTDFKRIN